MDSRAVAFFFLLVLAFQGNPSFAEECLVLRIPDFVCPFPACMLTCKIRAIGHHGKVKEAWCTGKGLKGICNCTICME
uniref:Knottin scorpion toxin-like domain-containing protein n=1 Tax=Oryza brachyantha TaxID=4533 RepID=J3N1W0_ORYBR